MANSKIVSKKDNKVKILLFVGLFAIIGGIFVFKSKAATISSPEFTIATDYYTAQKNGLNPNLTTTTDYIHYLDNNSGQSTVVVLGPGQQASFSPQKGGERSTTTWKRTCWSIKAVDTSVTATLVSGTNKINRLIPVSTSYQNQCAGIGTSTTTPAPTYDVKNNSTAGKLYIYQRTLYFTDSDPNSWAID